MILSPRRTALIPALLAGLALCALGGNACADEAADCTGYGALADTPDIALGTISGERVNFINNSDQKGCPSEAPACRAKAYLVGGNQVILSRTRGPFVCADYIGAKGADRAGWLPLAAVTREAPSAVTTADWLGAWTQTEATITIKPGKGGALALHGDATFGAEDPDRVKRGAVNVGEFDAASAPAGAALAFDVGTDKTLPVDKGDQYDCKVWIRRLGPYLLVDDNNNCGGANVSFRGVYVRKG